MNATIGTATEVVPGPAYTSDDGSLAEFVDTQGWGHHASCSCPIGADGDEMAVLDSAFRVRGTEGLRVVDASGESESILGACQKAWLTGVGSIPTDSRVLHHGADFDD